MDKTIDAFIELESKINKYRLKTFESIDQACTALLKKQKTSDYFSYTITNDPIVTYKNKHRGRAPKNKEPEKVAVSKDHFSIELRLNEEAVEKSLATCGDYPLITNKADLSLNEALFMLIQDKEVSCPAMPARHQDGPSCSRRSGSSEKPGPGSI